MRLDPDIDRRTAAFAERRFGYFTISEAYSLGHTPDSLRTRRRNGTYEKIATTLLRIAGAPRSWQGDSYAGVRGGPPGAVVGGLTATALFGHAMPPATPQVLVPPRSNARLRLAQAIRSPVDPRDRTTIGVIPVTTPARTVVDVAGMVGTELLHDIVDGFLTSGRLTEPALRSTVERLVPASGRKGIPALLSALEVWAPGIEHDSVAEARLFRFLRQWGFPMPESLWVVRDVDGTPVCEVDAAWPAARVALDYDSPKHHSPRRWSRDERRHGGAEDLGWDFVSVDKTDLHPGNHARFRAEIERLLRRAA